MVMRIQSTQASRGVSRGMKRRQQPTPDAKHHTGQDTNQHGRGEHILPKVFASKPCRRRVLSRSHGPESASVWIDIDTDLFTGDLDQDIAILNISA